MRCYARPCRAAMCADSEARGFASQISRSVAGSLVKDMSRTLSLWSAPGEFCPCLILDSCMPEQPSHDGVCLLASLPCA